MAGTLRRRKKPSEEGPDGGPKSETAKVPYVVRSCDGHKRSFEVRRSWNADQGMAHMACPRVGLPRWVNSPSWWGSLHVTEGHMSSFKGTRTRDLIG